MNFVGVYFFSFRTGDLLSESIKNEPPPTSGGTLHNEEQSREAPVPRVFTYRCLLFHRPGDGVSFIRKLNLACGVKPDRAFAGKVIVQMLVDRAEPAGLVLTVSCSL